MIPLYQRPTDIAEQAAVADILKSGQLSQGTYIALFEEEFAQYVGAPYVVAVDSCTNAIRMCLDYQIDVQKKSGNAEIPAMTFASVANEITRRPERYEMDGFNIKLRDDIEVGKSYEIRGTNIWDCAHEVKEGMYLVGSYMCFSLYPGKPISGAEGGLIATDDKDFVEWAKTYRQCGRDAYGATYDVLNKGMKINMTNLQACIGSFALAMLVKSKKKLAWLRLRYNEALDIKQTSDYVYRINVDSRDEFRKYMESNEIATSIHFQPLYRLSHYKDCGWVPEDFPVTEAEYKKTVTIPFYPDLSEADQDKIINVIQRWNS